MAKAEVVILELEHIDGNNIVLKIQGRSFTNKHLRLNPQQFVNLLGNLLPKDSMIIKTDDALISRHLQNMFG